MGGGVFIVSFLLGCTVLGYAKALQLPPPRYRAASAFTVYGFRLRGFGVLGSVCSREAAPPGGSGYGHPRVYVFP